MLNTKTRVFLTTRSCQNAESEGQGGKPKGMLNNNIGLRVSSWTEFAVRCGSFDRALRAIVVMERESSSLSSERQRIRKQLPPLHRSQIRAKQSKTSWRRPSLLLRQRTWAESHSARSAHRGESVICNAAMPTGAHGGAPAGEQSNQDDFIGPQRPELFDGPAMRREFWAFLRYAGPPTASYALDAAVEIIALTYIAKIGERELAAAGLAFMLSNMTGHAVYTGMSTALGTVGSQAFGAQKYHLVGNIMQQSLLVVGATLVPISILWAFAGSIFYYSGVVPEIATMAGTVIRMQIMTLPPMALMQLVKVWLESQGILPPITYASLVVCAMTQVFCHVLIGWDALGLGVYGAPVAIFAAYSIGDVALIAFIVKRGYHTKTWKGFSPNVWIGLCAFATMAYVGAGMVCLEWWSYEILGVVGSAFGETATAVQTVLVNFSYFLYAAGEGIAIAAGARVGNALGAGDAMAAKQSAVMAMGLSICSSMLIVLPLAPSEGAWSAPFLQEEESVELVATCTPALIIFLVFNGSYGALSGILLGSGKQKVGVQANLFACYLVGMPIGLMLSFYYQQSILGLWWGQCFGVAVLCVMLSGYLMSLDWDAMADKARDAAEKGEAELDVREAQFYALLESSLQDVEMQESKLGTFGEVRTPSDDQDSVDGGLVLDPHSKRV